MSRRSTRAFGFVAILALTLAGCGSSAPTAAPSSASGPSAATAPAASGADGSSAPESAGASGVPNGSSGPAGSGQPSAPVGSTPAASGTPAVPVGTDANLESLLPDTFQNVTLVKQSIAGPALATGGNDQSTTDILNELKALGKTPNDLSFAVANDPAGKLPVLFGAYRIKGVNAAEWLPQLIEIANKQSRSTTSQLNLGGKGVTKVVPANGHQPSYLWPRGDVLFIVITTDEAVAGEAIAALH